MNKRAVAAFAAPRARDARSRLIKVVDSAGNVVREISSGKLAEKILERAGIELDVVSGQRKRLVSCQLCGCPHLVSPAISIRAAAAKRCSDCLGERQRVCAGRDGPCPAMRRPSSSAFDPKNIKARDGGPWRCKSCAQRRLQISVCHDCGEPATMASSARSRGRGTRAYCAMHTRTNHGRGGGRQASVQCCMCHEAATISSAKNHIYSGVRPYCSKHKRGTTSVVTCHQCGAPVSSRTAAKVRSGLWRRGMCDDHKTRGRMEKTG